MQDGRGQQRYHDGCIAYNFQPTSLRLKRDKIDEFLTSVNIISNVTTLQSLTYLTRTRH